MSRLISCVQLVILLYKETATQSIQNQLHADSRLIENLCKVQGPSCQKLTRGTLLIPSSFPLRAQERDPLLQVRFQHHATRLFVGHSLVAGGMGPCKTATDITSWQQRSPHTHTHTHPSTPAHTHTHLPTHARTHTHRPLSCMSFDRRRLKPTHVASFFAIKNY